LGLIAGAEGPFPAVGGGGGVMGPLAGAEGGGLRETFGGGGGTTALEGALDAEVTAESTWETDLTERHGLSGL
jgi:hypothetical protein